MAHYYHQYHKQTKKLFYKKNCYIPQWECNAGNKKRVDSRLVIANFNLVKEGLS